MAEYIEREAVLKKLNDIVLTYIKDNSMQCILAAGVVCSIKEEVSEFPTADVEEVRHGKWEEEYPGSDNIVCPACGKLWNVLDNCTEEFDRCPKCGCVMDGKKEGVNNG